VLATASPCLITFAFYARWQRLFRSGLRPLSVLSCCSQEELLAHKLQSLQAFAAQSDLIFEFGERLDFLSLSLCLGKRERVHQLPWALSCRFVPVGNKGTKGSSGALRSIAPPLPVVPAARPRLPLDRSIRMPVT